MYSVNDVFIHKTPKTDEEFFVIKGAWAKTKDGDCWLIRQDGTGHAYAGKVTHVKNVWYITKDEFEEMTAKHLDWFTKN